MAEKLQFELVSPERQLVSETCDMVVVPGSEGDFGVLYEHAPFMTMVRPGVIEVYQGEQVSERIFVAGGFAEVNERGCIVLAEEALPVAELEREVVAQRLDTARRDLADLTGEGPEQERAARAVAIAEAMLEAAEAR